MLRRASVLVGLAVLLSLVFPVQAVLRASGVDPLAVAVPGVDLAIVCALVALLPCLALWRDARLGQRIPRWNAWVALLALFSVLFVVLHVHWARELAIAALRDALAPGGTLPLPLSCETLVHGAELAARLGVLVCAVGVLVNLRAVPQEPAAQPRRARQ